MNRKIFVLFLGALLLQGFVASAEHLKGGWIKYEYAGPGTTPGTSSYDITVYQYLDCNSTAAQIDAFVILGVFDAGRTMIQRIEIPHSGNIIENKQSFQCINNPPVVCYRIDYYTTRIELPSGGNGFTLSVQRCCRINNIVNISNSSQAGITYSVSIPGAGVSGTDYINKSAVFAQEDTAIVCRGNAFTMAFSATDPDGDSLRFRFVEGFGTSGVTAVPDPPDAPPYPSLSYIPPYAPAMPMGPTVMINPATGLITGTAPETTGDYVVAVAVDEYRNGRKIAESRKEIHVRVAACDIPSAVLDPKPTTCDGFTVQFENNSASPSIIRYNWDFGVPGRTDDTSNLPRPTYTYQDSGSYVVKLVVNKGNTCSDSTTQLFRVYPGFFPGFISAGVCKDIPVQFTDTTFTRYGVVNSWRWDFGDNTTSTDISDIRNPRYTYSTLGVKNVQLIVTNSKGCTDTAVTALTIIDKPALTVPFRDTLICSIDTLQLHAVGTGRFSWTPVYRISNATIANPLVNPLQTTTYTVTLNDQGCIAKDSIKINVLDLITVDAGRDTTICLTDTVALQAVSQALSYRWTPTATLINPNTKNPLAVPNSPFTTYTVTASLGKCQAVDNITIRAAPYPQANAGIDTSICFGGTAVLSGTAAGAIHNWSPAGLVRSSTALMTDAFPQNSTWYVLTVSDTLGCNKAVSDSVLVQVVPSFRAFAGNDTSIVIGQPLLMQPSVPSFATRYRWSPTIGMNDPLLLRPTVIVTPGLLPPGTDRLTYTLTASSPEGCAASDDIVVRIFTIQPTIFVPNAFTPNGDGNNDVLKPVLAGMQKLNFFRIYNRYGQLVYQTTQANQGWDGRIKGVPQATAGFVYMVQAIDYNGKVVQLSGTFTLIR